MEFARGPTILLGAARMAGSSELAEAYAESIIGLGC
jgi:hypothetical protein